MADENEFDKEQMRVKVQTAKEIAGGICKKHPELGQAGGALIFSRHVYRLARMEIDRMLGQWIDDPDIKQYVEEILVQSWAEASDQGAVNAALASTLIQGLQGTVLPFVSNWQSLQRRMEQSQHKELAEAMEDERRETALPIGFSFGAELGEYLQRDKTLCLVGRPGVLEWVIAEAVQEVLKQAQPKFRVVHLCHWAPVNRMESIDDVRSRGSLAVTTSQWKGCGDSQGKWDRFIETAAARLGGPIDLVAIDDVAPLYTRGLIGGRITYKADNAHKFIRRWADKSGSAVLLGLPFEVDPAVQGGPDLTSPAFEQLRTFTTLRPVWTKAHEADESKTEVWIGKNAHHWVLSSEVVS